MFIVSGMTLQMVMAVYTLMEVKSISPTSTGGKPMYWTGAGDVVVGRITDASGNLSPLLTIF
jgi:hypothetical protein